MKLRKKCTAYVCEAKLMTNHPASSDGRPVLVNCGTGEAIDRVDGSVEMEVIEATDEEVASLQAAGYSMKAPGLCVSESSDYSPRVRSILKALASEVCLEEASPDAMVERMRKQLDKRPDLRAEMAERAVKLMLERAVNEAQAELKLGAPDARPNDDNER